jgi:hypothetical protein
VGTALLLGAATRVAQINGALPEMRAHAVPQFPREARNQVDGNSWTVSADF